jgi:hypothetical protein
MGTSQECYLRNYLSSEDEDWQRQGLQVLHGQQDCKQQEEEVTRRLGSGKTIVALIFIIGFKELVALACCMFTERLL